MSADPPLPASKAASWLRRAAPRAIASLLIAAGFVWALRRGGLPFIPSRDVLAAELRWWCLPAFATLCLIAAAFRTWRWIYLLRPMAPALRPWRVFGVGLVGFSAIFFAPLRLGEFVRPYLITQEPGVNLMQAVGTLAAERVIDGLVLVLLAAGAFLLSTPLSPLPSHVGALPIPVALVPHTIFLAALMFSGAFSLMALFYFTRSAARRLVRLTLGLVSSRLADVGARLVDSLAESFGFLPSWQRSAPFLRNTMLYWLFNGLAHYALLRGVGLGSTVAQAFVTLGVIGLGSLLPAGPGFFGAFQMATYTSLAMYNSEHDVLTKGAVAVFGSYVTQLFINAISGGAGLLLLARVPAQRTTFTS